MFARNSLLYSFASELVRSGSQHGVGPGQLIFLMRELLRLLLELGIDLFEFRLLRLEIGLRFPQGASLLFELLIADAQLLRAGLQLFCLLLSFLQQFLEALPILRSPHGDRDGFGSTRQQLG